MKAETTMQIAGGMMGEAIKVAKILLLSGKSEGIIEGNPNFKVVIRESITQDAFEDITGQLEESQGKRIYIVMI